MQDRNNVLFFSKDLFDVLQERQEDIQRRVDQIPEADFRGNTDDQVVEHIASHLSIEPLAIHDDQMTMKDEEGQMDVSEWRERNPFRDGRPVMVASLRLRITLPFSGASFLWTCKPNTYGSNVPRGTVGHGQLVMVIELPTDSGPDQFKRSVEERVRAVRDYVGYQRSQVEQHNAQLATRVRDAVQRRRARIGKAAEILKAINIPLLSKPGALDVSTLQVKRRIVVPLGPPARGEKSYQIDDAVYEHILNVIRHEGATFETTRETYLDLGEESLRNIILAHLNGHYEGDAKGEAFRGAGKTDINIERENRAAFVAECKLWKGDKQLAAAVDQLLSYLTWRDGKTALVLFNKDVAAFADVQAKLPGLVGAHPKHAAVMSSGRAGEWRFRFRSKDDDGRFITIHVFLFNLYVTNDRR